MSRQDHFISDLTVRKCLLSFENIWEEIIKADKITNALLSFSKVSLRLCSKSLVHLPECNVYQKLETKSDISNKTGYIVAAYKLENTPNGFNSCRFSFLFFFIFWSGFFSRGVATETNFTPQIWPFSYNRCPSWGNLGSNCQRDRVSGCLLCYRNISNISKPLLPSCNWLKLSIGLWLSKPTVFS